MIATNSNGESKSVVRERFGVIWCPFCDRSKQISHGAGFCEGCNATFSDAPESLLTETSAPESQEEEPSATTRSRRQSNNS